MHYFSRKWICFNLGKFLEVDLENPFKTMSKLKGVFVPLKCKFYTHDINNWHLYNKTAFINIVIKDLMWKDKWHTPRFETSPIIAFIIWKYTICWTWELYSHLSGYIDDYWEQALWYLYYYKNNSQGRLDAPDIKAAKKNWQWTDVETGKSTWKDEYLTNKIRNELQESGMA